MENIMTPLVSDAVAGGNPPNKTQQYELFKDYGRIWLTIPLLGLMLLTVAGNVLVMVCVRVDKRLRSLISSIYVFSLAGADTLVGLFVMGGMCVYTVYGLWPLGSILCTIWVAFDFTCCTVSMLHLCLIAYDRFEAVVRPIKYRNNNSNKIATTRSVGAWLLGILVWLPAILAFSVISPGPENDCFFIPEKLYILIQAIIVYYIPILVMLVFYVGCLSVLRKRYMQTVASDAGQPKLFFIEEGTAEFMSSVVAADATLASDDNSHQSQLSAAAKAKFSKQQQQLRSIKTLGVVMAMFLFCWIPFCVFWPITAFCTDCISLIAYEYSYWIAYLNSTINPFLYFLSNRDFRHAFRHMINKGH